MEYAKLKADRRKAEESGDIEKAKSITRQIKKLAPSVMDVYATIGDSIPADKEE